MKKILDRSSKRQAEAQEATEKETASKWTTTGETSILKSPRKSSQICCKITDEEYSFLEELTVVATNKRGKGVNMAYVIRCLIRLGKENKDKLTFEEDV
jgi:hypothetical protein